MKVLTLSAHDATGGAARAALRLHEGLRALGIRASMWVQNKTGDDPTVFGPAGKLARFIGRLRPDIDSLPTMLYPRRKRVIFSPAVLPDNLPAIVDEFDPDIVHLHWVGGGFMRVETLRRLQRPLIWTLHDSWAFTGGCHVPFDCMRYRERCGACPALGSTREADLSRRLWQRKRHALNGVDLTIVCPSRWLRDCAAASSLFDGRRIERIPNGLDLSRFKPMDKRMARELLGLPQDKKLILFGALRAAGDQNKGLHLLVPALRALADQGYADQARTMVMGASASDDLKNAGLEATFLGRLHDDVSLALCYSAADVFVSPSIQENLPNAVMEALACGTPAIAFAIGGMPDLIEHQVTGYLATPFESGDLAQGIHWVLQDRERWARLSGKARAKVEQEFSLEYIARRYAALYGETLALPTPNVKAAG